MQMPSLNIAEIGVLALVFAAVVAFVAVFVQTLKSAAGSPFLAWLGPRWVDEYRERKRKAMFEDRILDLTMGLANAMKAGMALPQALEKVSGSLAA